MEKKYSRIVSTEKYQQYLTTKVNENRNLKMNQMNRFNLAQNKVKNIKCCESFCLVGFAIIVLTLSSFLMAANVSAQTAPSNNAITQTSSQQNINDNIVLHLTFNDQKGTIAQDSSSYNNSATLHNFNFTEYSGWTKNGKFGSALSFDGLNDYISIPDNPTTSIQNQDWTVSMWVYPNANSTDTQFLYNDGGNPWYNTFRLTWTTDDKFQCFVRDSQNNYAPATSHAHAPGQWYNVVGVWSQSQKTSYIYVNGNLEGSYTKKAFQNINTTGGLPPTIGGTSNSNFFNGKIDEVTVYNCALTPQEITQLNSTNPDKAIGSPWIQALPFAAVIVIVVAALLFVFRKNIHKPKLSINNQKPQQLNCK